METNNLPVIYAVAMADMPMRYSSAFPLKIIIAHACSLSKDRRSELAMEGCLFDDDCDNNISALNPWWGELTALHWLMQQSPEGIIGNAQYRRFWADDSLATVTPNALYLSEPCMFPCSMADQFRGGHRFPGVELTMEVARQEDFPFSEAEMAQVWRSNRFQGGPMAVGSWPLYQKLMSVLFDCLWPIWQAYGDDIQTLQGYDQRAMAFLSERLLSGIVLMQDKFLPETTLRTIPLHYIAP